MFYLLVMDIRVEHHEVILLCLVYEGVFMTTQEDVNLEMLVNTRQSK